MFDDKYMFTDGQFTLVLWEMDFGSVIELTDSLKKFKQNNRFSMTQFSLEILKLNITKCDINQFTLLESIWEIRIRVRTSQHW